MTCPRCATRHALYKDHDELVCLYCGHVVHPTAPLPYVNEIKRKEAKGVQYAGS